MRVAILAAAIGAVSTSLYAAQFYDGYDAFYTSRVGAVFGEPIRRDTGVVYSQQDGEAIYTDWRATLAGKEMRIRVSPNRITVNGRIYNFLRSATLPDERVASIYPETANVFLAAKTEKHLALLCMEGHSSGSGEANRYRQIFLLLNPPGRDPTFLHLPGLLSSCRAVLATSDGQLAFPRNSYLVDEVQGTRVGLLVSYFTFERRSFMPTNNKVRLRFVSPENPFKFSLQDE
jgi:hypothetical protein